MKDKNFFKAYSWFKHKKLSNYKGKNFVNVPCIFHGLEGIILFSLLGLLISKIFYFITLGFLFHLIIDWVEFFSKHKKFSKISFVYDLIKFKKNNFQQSLKKSFP